MKSTLYTLVFLTAGAGALTAQVPLSAVSKARAAAAAASRQATMGEPAKETAKPGTPAKRNAAANVPPARQQGAPTRSTAASARPRGAGSRAGRKGAASAAAAATAPSPAPPKAAKDTVVPRVLMRETFDYVPDGRRDPFVSLMASSELRPTIADLRLTGILYDLSGRRPIAIMRDVQTNAQYRVTNGMTLGRMRVARIRPKVIVFSIEEFGLNRTDSLVLGDTSRVRTK